MTQTITIRGASDDLIEVEGTPGGGIDGIDEYGAGDTHAWHYLVASDGSVVAVAYYPDGEGGWQVKRLVDGTASWRVEEIGEDDDPIAQGTLTGELTAIHFVGTDFEVATQLAHLLAVNPAAWETAKDIRDVFAEQPGFDDYWDDLDPEIRTGILLDIADKIAPPNPTEKLLARLLLAIENPANPMASFEQQYYNGELNDLLTECYQSLGRERPQP